ncbi:MAG: hypothetical protein IJM80_06955 [Firmicutes bacterium]|nr:hypothetical protein [Bacillota bacterium]
MDDQIICPKCGKPMEKGHLFSNTIHTVVYWMPGDKRPYWHGVRMFLYDVKNMGGELITGDRPDNKCMLNGFSSDAYYCRDCRCGYFEAREPSDKSVVW